MQREFRLFLQDIVKAAKFIERYIQDLSYEEFVADEVLLHAVLNNLTIIGEAIKQVPQDIRQRYPNIPWREIGRARDVIVHGYFALNLTLTWHAASVEVPELRQQIEAILEEIAGQIDDQESETN
jgi:uncharacterized protein with HEPN domain